ncbi:MAG: HlyC/CorC family transporter [Deltaproteobacteria bacterium]|nr:HlyC/CorC family transporter [Deltaproteobacteria bacterium]
MIDPHPSVDFFGVVWRLGATLFFVALNGFFVAAEFALVKAREPRIAQLGRDGSRAAPSVQHILRNLDRYLSACQLGITLASLILGALGEPAVSVLLIATADAVGLPVAEGAGWVPFVSIALAFTVITVLHMTVGEQAPKMWALRRAEKMALATAPALRGFAWLFGPFIDLINWIANGLLKLIGLPPELGHESSHSSEEIRSILSLSARSGKISDHEYELSENVFRIIELEVRHIVVPRIEIDFLVVGNSLEENLEHIRTDGHSRFALCELGLDTIIGIVHSKDVLDAMLRGETPDLRAIARPPVFVSDTMSLSNLLRELQQHRQQCAVVLDEHGTAIGLAFREDALEEIVGPLGDEFDDEEPDFVELSDGVYELSGRMPLPELEDRLDFDLPEEEGEEEDSIGGHVTARLGRLPRKGDAVRVGPFLATVIDASRRRAQKLRITLAPPDEDDAEDGGSSTAT